MPLDRECDEEQRIESQRDKQPIVLDADFEIIKKNIQDNISDVKAKFDLANREKVSDIHAAEEIWRSQVVFLDSALDFYVHEVTTYGIIKIFNGDWADTQAFKDKRVSLGFAIEIMKNPENAVALLKDEINTINQQYCFMEYKNIATNLKMVGIQPDNSKHNAIDKFYKRRNLIAHQSDRLAGETEKQPISEQDVIDFINLVEAFVDDINQKVEVLNRS